MASAADMKSVLIPVLLFLACPASADLRVDNTRLEASAGVYCAIDSVGHEIAPGTDVGRIDLLEHIPNFQWSTMTVPAKIGVSFGVKTKTVNDVSYDNVIVTITHPPFGETGTTQQSYVTTLGGTSINAYSFDIPRELTLGTWTLTARWQDTIFYTASFEVVEPIQALHIAQGCGGGHLS